METERLIRTLALDAPRAAPMGRAWAVALAAALAGAAIVFFSVVGPRPDIAAAAETWRFLYKFVVTIALLAASLWALAALARPGGMSPARLAALLVAPCLLAASVLIEVAALPSDQLGPRLLGNNALLCLTFIPLIGVGPAAAFLLALRHGAPTSPALAGAVAGLAAGGLAATFYAAHCTDDSPLFVATWYPMAIAILAAAGAAAGRLVIRW
ncbi:NrsF family protein [Mesorhizobium sp. KR9-304]|uniref:NrsF family protein n=1 Tax=Mesorhizobium sp. KR9-304 TaxID=3156614 RepID=UPI0032B58D2D